MTETDASGGTDADGSAAPIRIFLLDDHEVVRKGVAGVLSAEEDMTIVGEHGAAAGALDAVRDCAPDVAVLDVRLGDGSGIEVCRDIRSELPSVSCLMLTSFSEEEAVVDAAMAGAAGYVLKQIRTDALVDAIRQVAAGVTLLDEAEVRLRMRRIADTAEGGVRTLTPQERKIFDLIGEGLSNREIAAEMYLAEKTVKNYASNVFVKLGITRRTQAAAMAARMDERRRQGHGG